MSSLVNLLLNAAKFNRILVPIGHTKEQNLLLCNGVGEMLTKGKSTCVTLKAAIDGALTILIGDATKARDNMTNSCDKVREEAIVCYSTLYHTTRLCITLHCTILITSHQLLPIN